MTPRQRRPKSVPARIYLQLADGERKPLLQIVAHDPDAFITLVRDYDFAASAGTTSDQLVADIRNIIRKTPFHATTTWRFSEDEPMTSDTIAYVMTCAYRTDDHGIITTRDVTINVLRPGA